MPWIKAIYRAENADMALVRLDEFESRMGKALSRDWAGLARGVGACRKMTYTINAVEALNRALQKIIKCQPTSGTGPLC
jgi:putative transposase